MGLQAAEQLVQELAAGREGKYFKTTEDQQELNIPPFLVYLLGIVIAEEEYQRWKEQKPQLNNSDTSLDFSLREARFATFQKQYWTFVNNASVRTDEQQLWKSSSFASKSYRLTTRVCPSKEQQATVKRDLLKECEKLESLSRKALEALLKEEYTSSQDASKKNNKRGKKKTKKQKNKQKITATKNIQVEGNEEGGTKANTLKEVVATTLQNSSIETTVEETSWIEIKRKEDGEVTGSTTANDLVSDGRDALATNRPTTPVAVKIESGVSMKKDEGPTPIKNNENGATSDITDNNSHEDKYSPLPIADSYAEEIGTLINNLSSPLPPNNLSSSNTTSDHNNSLHHAATNNVELEKQTRRVADLEQNLTDVNRQLTEERLAHSKLLRKEKEQYENLIQALQLRLYISENKLQTYEDALETHIQAVSAISSSNGTAKRNNEEERIPGSPSLISKVLENNNQGNGKTGDRIW